MFNPFGDGCQPTCASFLIRIEILDYWEGKRGRGTGETLYLSLNKDAPEERVQELAELGMIRALPMVARLHHCYTRRAT